MEGNATVKDMDICRTGDPAGCIGDGGCVLVLPDGVGRARIIADAACRMGAARILIVASKAYAGTVWGHDLSEAIGAMPGMSGAAVVPPQRSKDWGGEAARAAASSIPDATVFYVITPNQAASAGAWCSAHGRSPFGLVVADQAGMYANPKSERASGIASVASFSRSCVGILPDYDIGKLPAMAADCWGGPRAVVLDLAAREGLA